MIVFLFGFVLAEVEGEDEDNELMKMVRGPDAAQRPIRTREDLYLEGKIWSFIRRYPTS